VGVVGVVNSGAWHSVVEMEVGGRLGVHCSGPRCWGVVVCGAAGSGLGGVGAWVGADSQVKVWQGINGGRCGAVQWVVQRGGMGGPSGGVGTKGGRGSLGSVVGKG